MTDRPGWLTDQPVDVDVDGLNSFAALVQAELDQNVVPGANSVLTHLTGDPDSQGQRTFGVDSRYHQGVIIGNYHSECENRARALLEDFQHGLAAIAAAAHSIAVDYRSVDSQNDMDLKKIEGYFHPTDRSHSLAEMLGYPVESEEPEPPSGGNPLGGPI